MQSCTMKQLINCHKHAHTRTHKHTKTCVKMRMQACRSLQIIYKYALDPPIKNSNYEFIISKNIGYGQKVDKQKRAVNKKTTRKANFGDWGCSINNKKKTYTVLL